jgi:hypothetical protein
VLRAVHSNTMQPVPTALQTLLDLGKYGTRAAYKRQATLFRGRGAI